LKCQFQTQQTESKFYKENHVKKKEVNLFRNVYWLTWTVPISVTLIHSFYLQNGMISTSDSTHLQMMPTSVSG